MKIKKGINSVIKNMKYKSYTRFKARLFILGIFIISGIFIGLQLHAEEEQELFIVPEVLDDFDAFKSKEFV